MSIPRPVEKLVDSLPQRPIALIGCRAAEASLDCCEYDIAVFSKPGDNKVIRLRDHTVELLYLGDARDHMIDLYGMRIIRDDNTFSLASTAKGYTEDKHRKALKAHGRKLLVSSLFCQRIAQEAGEPTISHMWTKMGAYRFISGALALSGQKPRPTHELGQARQLEVSDKVAEGVSSALEAVGLERATRPAIARSVEALRELVSKDYDRELVMSKIEFLRDRQMLSDCYFYIGKVATESLSRRNEGFHRKYTKLVQLALDLTSDAQLMDKLRRSLFKAATTVLGD
jgi:hypothetical protein